MSKIVGLVFKDTAKTIEEMKKDELIALAQTKEIKIDPNSKVDEIRQALEEALRDK